MITPSFALTATERVLPSMALDFTTASLDSRVTFTRTGNTATVTNSSGVIAAINANLPRFDFNPTTLVCNGLLIEEARTNLLLNSLIDGTNLGTQLVTTTAVAHTLSFYGTGQIVLTGTSSATVVGTGAYPSRKTLTFTPTVGVLTLTVTGTVQYAQLEIGAFATSFIPTAASQVTRTADVAAMTGTNFSSWYNAAEGAFLASCVLSRQAAIAATTIFSANDNAGTNTINCFYRGSGALGSTILTASVSQFDQVPLGVTIANVVVNIGIAYKLNNSVSYANATVQATDTSVTIPTVTQLQLGIVSGGAYLNGILKSLKFYKQRILNAEGQAFSK